MALELVQHKAYMRAILFDGAGLDETLHAELAGVRLVAQSTQFSDGNVITLVGSVAGEGEPADGADDDGGRYPDSKRISGSFHDHFNDTSVESRGQ